MQIKLRYFAIVRQAMGRSEELREVTPGTTSGDLLTQLASEQPALKRLQGIVLLMVNQEFADPAHQLADGDEVAFIPPVSGGSDRFRVQAEPIDVRAVEASVIDASVGGVVTFTGTVRGVARGRTVTGLDYEAYQPAAERMLTRIGDEVAANWGIRHFTIVHRTGMLRVGEASVVIVAAAAHRAEAFAACEYAIDRIKVIVPIWKHEHYVDGTHWVGTEAEYQAQVNLDSASTTGN